jgi:hypothetical protein
MKGGKSLSAGQRRELAVLQQQYLSVESVSCATGTQDGRPFAVVPAGYAPAVALDDQLADVFAVSERTVREWKSSADWPAGQRGPYLLGGRLSEFVRKLHDRPASPSDLQLADLELKRARAELLRDRLTMTSVSRRAITQEQLDPLLAMFARGLDGVLKDADDTYAGVRNFILDRIPKLHQELRTAAVASVGDGGTGRGAGGS